MEHATAIANAPLTPFTDFAQVFDAERYRAVHEDWYVAVSDVVDSTAAIKAGRYKDVNMAGAATIAAVLNAAGHDDLPFAFGGDGGVVLLPPELESAARSALAHLRTLTRQTMGLTLRCALIPVAELRKRGSEVMVALHDLGSGRTLAMLAGGGIETAERLCKSHEGAAFVVDEAKGDCDLTGLSCRWEPLKPEHGLIVALVVQSRTRDSVLPRIYREIYERIGTLAGPGASPAKSDALRLRWPPRGMHLESALVGRAMPKRKILFEVAAEFLSLFTGKSIGGFNARAYHDSLPRHSDYRKYADSLRMVIDCAPAQADAISALLDAEWKKGTIDYGTHRANAALMTCFVRTTEDAGHVHFIDGADGGYALAALDMKQRMAGMPVQSALKTIRND